MKWIDKKGGGEGGGRWRGKGWRVTRFIVAGTEILRRSEPRCNLRGDNNRRPWYRASPLFYSHYVLHLKKAISEIICAGSGGRYFFLSFFPFFFFFPKRVWMRGVFPGNNAERVSGGSGQKPDSNRALMNETVYNNRGYLLFNRCNIAC